MFGEAGANAADAAQEPDNSALVDDLAWPSLRVYDRDHLARIALPLGGIGTGTVSLGGRGDLRDWEVMNRPGKGFVPVFGGAAPFLALFAQQGTTPTVCRLLEGPVDASAYEGSHGAPGANLNLPRFRDALFATAYPFGRVVLRDADVPLEVHLRAFNPLVPGDAEASGLPLASFTVELRNTGASAVTAVVCGRCPTSSALTARRRRGTGKAIRITSGRRATATTRGTATACAACSCSRAASTRSPRPGAPWRWPRRLLER